uniref:Uncharacterized protein n=1 Tax=viral metagenome TaxID=1070528 RepID=A0A6C0H8V7_9ZZZZ
MFNKYIKYKKKYLNIKKNISVGGDRVRGPYPLDDSDVDDYVVNNNIIIIYLKKLDGVMLVTHPILYDSSDISNDNNMYMIITYMYNTIINSITDNNMTFRIWYQSKVIFDFLVNDRKNQLHNTLLRLTPLVPHDFLVDIYSDKTESIINFHNKQRDNINTNSLIAYKEHINDMMNIIYENFTEQPDELLNTFRDHIKSNEFYTKKDKYFTLAYLSFFKKHSYTIYYIKENKYISESIDNGYISSLFDFCYTDDGIQKIYDKQVALAYIQAGQFREIYNCKLIRNIITDHAGETEIIHTIILNLFKCGSAEIIFQLFYDCDKNIMILDDFMDEYLLVKLIISSYIATNANNLEGTNLHKERYMHYFGFGDFVKDNLEKLNSLVRVKAFLLKIRTNPRFIHWLTIDEYERVPPPPRVPFSSVSPFLEPPIEEV